MSTTRLIATMVAAAAISAVSAQDEVIEAVTVYDPEGMMRADLVDNTQLIYFGDDDINDSTSYRNLLEQFYEDQFRHSQDPRAPYFMLMSRSGSLAMGVGGDLKMIGAYDWHGSIGGVAFVPYNISIPADHAASELMQLTPNHTSIYMSVFGNDRRFGTFQIYIQGKFSGPGNAFKLSRAYATVGDWTFGYTKSTFDDPVAQPSTIDTEGPNSEIDDTRVLVRYMHSLSDKLRVALSVENPGNRIPSTSSYEGINNYMPDIGAFVQYNYANQHVRLSGLAKGIGYRDLVNGVNHHVAGWGVNLSGKLHIAPALNVYASYNMGRGIGNMVNDLSYGDNDLLGMADEPGRMYAPMSYGWYGALQYYYNPRVFSTLIVSQVRMLPKADAVYGGDGYRYGLYGTGNVFWNIAPRLQLGAEFNIGKRCNMDGASRLGYRASLMADFSF